MLFYGHRKTNTKFETRLNQFSFVEVQSTIYVNMKDVKLQNNKKSCLEIRNHIQNQIKTVQCAVYHEA